MHASWFGRGNESLPGVRCPCVRRSGVGWLLGVGAVVVRDGGGVGEAWGWWVDHCASWRISERILKSRVCYCSNGREDSFRHVGTFGKILSTT